MARRQGYIPLRLLSDSSDEPSIEQKETSHRRYSASTLWMFALCVICTVVNISLATWFPVTARSDISERLTISRDDLPFLRRPNQFIGFDDIIRSVPVEPKQFHNFPSLVQAISRDEPEKVFDVDPHRVLSPIGLISPEARTVIITDTISTIFQFRAMDWGMETCELHLNISAEAARSMQMTGHGAPVALFRLKLTAPLKGGILSYKTRPFRVAKFTEILVDSEEGVHWSRQFACGTDELLAFELAGGSPSASQISSCNLEWSQDKGRTAPENAAMFIIQRATK